mmetsp:Transcript_29832/g.45471  ORF Transcript_29832/g.45471 Transcript_29832/m.45471 type:complete len:420 (-) Transcript_29832:87-1346(-)
MPQLLPKLHRSSTQFALRALHSPKIKYLLLCFVVVVIVLLFRPRVIVVDDLLRTSELENLIQELRGDDLRLVRWSATKYTKKRQNGICDESLPQALRTIASSSSTFDQELACVFATFCITDNPEQRARLGDDDYVAIVKLVYSTDSHASAMASHLIYIASFSNQSNHQGFFQAGATLKLANVVKDKDSSKLAIMWAAAALQNLAASYCSKFKGRCIWDWEGNTDLSIKPKDNVVISDGSSIRKDLLNDSDLVNTLKKLACQGPVRGDMTDENPYVGKNAIIGGAYDESPNIVSWAATGVLKNLALEPTARILIGDGETLKCICRLAHSPDWLEENKGKGALHYLRPSDPCWFQDDDYENGELCVDDLFLDQKGYTCTDYGSATDQECWITNKYGVSAREACCACQGRSEEPNIFGKSGQ